MQRRFRRRNVLEIKHYNSSIDKIRRIYTSNVLDEKSIAELKELEQTLENNKAELQKLQSKSNLITFLKRFGKVLILIAIIKLIRNFIRTNDTVHTEVQTLFTQYNVESVLFFLLISTAGLLLSCLVYYCVMNYKKGNLLNSPFVIFVIGFIFIDCLMVLIFPEVTIAVFEAYLLGS